MKKLLWSFGAFGVALAAQAQSSTAPVPAPEISEAYPVASPHRTRLAERAAETRRDKHNHRHARHPESGLDALVWVDATGKTVGRFYDMGTVVVAFNNQLAFVRGLRVGTCPDSGNPCSYAGGTRWFGTNFSNQLYYPSSDCSGPAYSFFPRRSPQPTPYYGFPVEEEDTTYIYFFKQADRVPVMLNSSFASKFCSTMPQGFIGDVAPAAGVVPAATLGVEPYMVK